MSDAAKPTPATPEAKAVEARFANMSPAEAFMQRAYENESPEGVGDFFNAKIAPPAAIDRDKIDAFRQDAEQAAKASPAAPRRPGSR